MSSIRRSFFARENRLSGTARTAYSFPPKGSISKPMSVNTFMWRFKRSASCKESVRMIGGFTSWEVYSLVFRDAKFFSKRTFSWAACWSIM